MGKLAFVGEKCMISRFLIFCIKKFYPKCLILVQTRTARENSFEEVCSGEMFIIKKY